MVKVVVPATSANLGPGFDSLGIALTLYNEFYFQKSNEFAFVNMPKKYSNTDNLVIRASLKTYEYLNIKPVKYTLEIKSNIPSTRGLGSSATCIVAGIIIVSYFSEKKLLPEEIIKIGTEIEGHPDNIAPAVLGALVGTVNCDKIITNKYYVNPKLIFTIVVPEVKLETSEARKVLPKELPLEDAIYSLSRAINLPKAIGKGSIEMLYELLKDKIHQPYRFPLIPDSEKYLQYSRINKIPFCISGSGSCMLFISENSIIEKITDINKEYEVLELKASIKGGKIYEE